MSAEDLSGTVVLVGGGQMGGALMGGWLARGLAAEDLHVVEPDPGRRAELARKGAVRLHAAASEVPAELVPDALVLAVKPQVMPQVLGECTALAARARLILSVAAGVPLAAYERAFGARRPIVRAMPNTPAAVGRGTSVLVANEAVDGDGRRRAEALLQAVGTVHWLDREDLLHAVTALSGSGPAYVFLLVEAMGAAGTRLGLPAGLAMRLARETVSGAGALLAESEAEPAALRRAVTSPGGTTEAALSVLMGTGGLLELIARAMAAAERRSRELGAIQAGEPKR